MNALVQEHFHGLLETDNVIEDALEAVRSHLDMDMAYLSEAYSTDIQFHNVTGTAARDLVHPGGRVPLDDMYCSLIVAGRLPNVVHDTQKEPLTRDLKLVRDAHVRSFVSVPVNRSDGSLFGMFCCFSRDPKPDLNMRDVNTVSMFANLTARSLNRQLDERFEIKTLRKSLGDIISNNRLTTYLQPIVSLSSGRIMATEALSRFFGTGDPSPEKWFRQALKSDMQVDLELAAIRKALDHLQQLPPNIYMTVNASPATVSHPGFMAALRQVPPNRLVIELTEHDAIKDQLALVTALDALRARRIGVGIDDVGAGYSGLNTIVQLRPDVLKLDRALVDRIQSDTVKQSLTSAMVHFANAMEAYLIAEGIETAEEDAMLRKLGVRLGQGFHYARPMEAIAAISNITERNRNIVRPHQAS